MSLESVLRAKAYRPTHCVYTTCKSTGETSVSPPLSQAEAEERVDQWIQAPVSHDKTLYKQGEQGEMERKVPILSKKDIEKWRKAKAKNNHVAMLSVERRAEKEADKWVLGKALYEDEAGRERPLYSQKIKLLSKRKLVLAKVARFLLEITPGTPENKALNEEIAREKRKSSNYRKFQEEHGKKGIRTGKVPASGRRSRSAILFHKSPY